MEYKVKFTEKCLEDIEHICEYISRELNAEQAAIRLRTKIKERVNNLTKTPEMYEKINKMDRLKRMYRRIVINNYILLYSIDEIEKVVYVSHMYYGERNYLEGLI